MTYKMDFLTSVLKGSAPFDTLKKSIKNGRSLCAAGLSAVNKANIIFALCRQKQAPALCIASDEKEAQTLCNDLCCMGLKALVYPVRDYNFIDLQSRSREYEHQRLKALLRLSEGECDVVIACLDAAAQLTVPKRVLLDTSVVFEQGATSALTRLTAKASSRSGAEFWTSLCPTQSTPSAPNFGATKSPI